MDVVRISSSFPPVNLPVEMEEPQHIPPSRVLGVLWRQKFSILAVVLGLSIPACAIVFLLPPYYDSTAVLMVDTGKSSFHDLQATITTPETDAVAIMTQVGILKSPSIAATVVDRLDLTRSPEFTKVLDAPPSALTRVMGDGLAILGMKPRPPTKLTAAQRRLVTAGLLDDKVTVLNDGKSYLISVRARSGDAELSTSIANAFVDAYLDFKQSLKVAAIKRANGLLDVQIAPIAARVQKADEAVENFRARNGLIVSRAAAENAPDEAGGSTVADQQLAQINGQLVSAQAELAMRQASLRQIEAALRGGRLDSIPEVVASPLIASLRAQQADQSSRADALGQTEMSANPALQAARASSATLQRRIDAEIGKIASSVRSQSQAASAQVSALQGELARLQSQVGGQGQANVTLRQLESEAKAVRGIYQDYLGRFEQTSTQSSLQEPEADLVSAAQIAVGKSGPPRGLFMALVVVVSGFIACLGALLRDRIRQGMRSLEQMEAQTGLLGLGFVPATSRSLRNLAKTQEPSVYSESISRVSTLLLNGSDRHRAQVVLVTSAAPNEGKTFFAISLAATIGREGGRALLIDCDMRRPTVAARLEIQSTSTQTLAGAMLSTGVLTGLDVVTFRPVAKGERQAVSAVQIQSLLDEARRLYDLIVLDTPPVLAFADTPILSLKADGAIMVVRWRATPAAVVQSAVRALNTFGVRVLGGVMTQVRLDELAEEDGGLGFMYRKHSAYFR